MFRMVGKELSIKQCVMLAMPAVLIITMYLAFQWLVALLGYPLGYLAAFCLYWLGWCIGLPLLILGPKGLLDLFKDTDPRFGKPAWKTLALLCWPLIFPLLFIFLPRISMANLWIVLASIAIGLVIGITEEALWRGVYVKLFPDNV